LTFFAKAHLEENVMRLLRNISLTFAISIILSACGPSQTELDTETTEKAAPQTAAEPTEIFPYVASITEQSMPVGDGSLFVRIVGDPAISETIIAIHGGPGMSGDYLRSMEVLASRDLAVVTYDQRGSGRSTMPSAGFTFEDYNADLEAVREFIGASEVHLLGHSWGGLVAMSYTIAFPENVASLILASSAPPDVFSLRVGVQNLNQRIEQLQSDGLIPNPIPEGDDIAILPAYFADPNFEIPDELKSTTFTGGVNQGTFRAILNFDLTEELSKLDQRVLILWGEQDSFGLAMGEASQQALSSADLQLVLLEDCGHYYHECKEDFFSQIVEFLDFR
jgi:pimeloyl-ACP methyl ester carboxylesterase